ncbi:MAG TPA: HAD-IA family hydrolase, partial [Ktedonobacteraceae bacterium]|nr:HAD-IA family hydrolase [Ktedonobacteraceae bacterium]
RFSAQEGELYKIIDPELDYLASIGKVPEPEMWQQVGVALSLRDEELLEFIDDFWSGGELNQELAAFLHSLRPRYKTALLSNAWSGAREAVTRIFRLNDFADAMFFSAEEGLAKPDSAFYHIAINWLKIPPSAIIFVDDRPENIEAACTLGMHGILYTDNNQTITEVESCLEIAVDDDTIMIEKHIRMENGESKKTKEKKRNTC